jgi:spermidine synthase
MTLWFYEVFEDNAQFGLKVTEHLYHAQSPYQTIDIMRTDRYGKVLALDGLYQTSIEDEFFYHEMLIHPALTTAAQIERVLVIGGGDGGSIREILSYPEVKRVTMVEIDGMVIDACKRHMSEICQVWQDPRLDLRVGDGIAYVEKYTGEPYDVIIVDGSDPVGPAEGLFTLQFYRNCKKNLNQGGVLAVQSESPQLMTPSFQRVLTTLQQVFSRVRPYFAPVPLYPGGGWSYTYATEEIDPLRLIEPRVERAEKHCRYYNREIHRGAFAVPNNLKSLLG